MKLATPSGGISVARRTVLATAVVVLIAAIGLCWWLSHHTVIRIINYSGSDLSSVVVEARDGVQIIVKETTALTAGQSQWVSLPCTGHCSYMLKVQFADGRAYKTEERYAEAWHVASEKVGDNNSVYE